MNPKWPPLGLGHRQRPRRPNGRKGGFTAPISSQPLLASIVKHFATYPANLCPLLWWAEFAEFGSDFGEPVRQSIEDRQRITGVGQGAPKHFQDVLSNLYSLKGAGEVGLEADDALGRGQEMPGLGT